MTICAIVLTHNSAKSLEECLASLTFCDEVLVVDDASTDGTRKIASEKGARVVEHELANDFAAQRNWAMQQTSHNWVLFVDSDERVSDSLRVELTKLKQRDPSYVSGFRIPRRDFFLGREMKYGETSQARLHGFVRLVSPGSGAWKGSVHEEWQPRHGTIEQLPGFLDHKPHPTIAEFLSEVNRYSTLRARELQNQGKRAGVWELCAYPFGKFLYTYLWKRGYADGPEGFIYSFMMSFHSFLVRAKLIQYSFYDPSH